MSKLAEIRMLFEAKTRDGAQEPFDSRDMERVKSDKYLYRVLEHCQNDVQLAAQMLYEIMEWRKSVGANAITEETVNLDYLKEGIFFPHGRDIDSCILFIMKSKLYIKGQKNMDELKKIIIYWLERIEREEGGKKMTLFFDMDGCGLNNMDIEIIMYMVTLLKSYYPNLINYVIIFQLPWIMSAGFKIVKGLLPAPAVERLRMVKKERLSDLVVPEQALVSWGGKDPYVFKFISENLMRADKVHKHVSFADTTLLHLKLTPNKILVFKSEQKKISSQLNIFNMCDDTILYKIRTTAPEKYTVRPSSGTLLCQESQIIQITVNPGFSLTSVEKDKFLVVSLKVPISNVSSKEVADLWKSGRSKINEYRLNCSSIDTETNVTIKQSKDPESIEYKLNNLQNSHKALLKNLHMMKIIQMIILGFTFVNVFLVFYIYMISRRGSSGS